MFLEMQNNDFLCKFGILYRYSDKISFSLNFYYFIVKMSLYSTMQLPSERLFMQNIAVYYISNDFKTKKLS